MLNFLKSLWQKPVEVLTELDAFLYHADALEARRLIQTIQIPANETCDINVSGMRGGYQLTEFGPCRIIIVKEPPLVTMTNAEWNPKLEGGV